MNLSQRLVEAGVATEQAWADAAADADPRPPAKSLEALRPRPQDDVLSGLKGRLRDAMFARLGPRLYDAGLDEEQLRRLVLSELTILVEAEPTPLTPEERERLVQTVSEDVLGYGPIEKYLADPTVTEIMVNHTEDIYIERDGLIERTQSRFTSGEHLLRVIERIVSQVGRRVDEASPMVDARLPDGSRVNAVIPPVAVDGPSLTVRKFSADPYQAEDLIDMGTMSAAVADFLTACVRGRLNILVSGGTGTGKTTLLNVLSSFIPEDQRIVTIEDAVELQLCQHHVVRLEGRPPNVEGHGSVGIGDLLRNALRMRPDRILVGEVRGAEALDMLQAMNTGHEGSLSTVHANSPRDALSRVETMVLMAGTDLPARAVREQMASALDLIVHLARLRDGTRRITHITEVAGMEGQLVTLQDIYLFDYGAGVTEEGRFLGRIEPTGIRPGFSTRLADLGIALSPDLFGSLIASTSGKPRDIR